MAITENALVNMGGSEPKDLFDDNYSWFDRSDISDKTGFNKHEASGLMSTLNEKKLIFDYEDDGTGWCMTNYGITFAQKLFEELNEWK